MQDYRRLLKTTEEDPKIVQSYTNKFKCNKGTKEKWYQKGMISSMQKKKIGYQIFNSGISLVFV